MKSVSIILMCVAAAIAYGITQDQIAARVCLEYFTIGHPPLFSSQDPTVIGFAWGVVGSWWVGALLGGMLAFASRVGSAPKRSPTSLTRSIVLLLALMALLSAVAGIVGWLLARSGAVILLQPLAEAIPTDRHARFIGVLWSHVAGYSVGFVGGVTIAARVWRARRRSVEAGRTPIGATA